MVSIVKEYGIKCEGYCGNRQRVRPLTPHQCTQLALASKNTVI